MYWPVNSPTILASPTTPTLPGASPAKHEPIISLCQNRSSSLFVSVTRNGLALWSVKPSVVLAMLERNEASIEELGQNIGAWFSWDSLVVLVITSKSHLISYNLYPLPSPYPYLGTLNARTSTEVFKLGAGEGGDLLGWGLEWNGSWLIEGEAKSLTTHAHHVLIAVSSPTPSLLLLPYPLPEILETSLPRVALPAASSASSGSASTLSITHSRPLNLHTVILPTGQTYLLHSKSPPYQSRAASSRVSISSEHPSTPTTAGTDGDSDQLTFGARQVELKERGGWDGRRSLGGGLMLSTEEIEGVATVAALNAKFALVAVGTESGLVHIHTLPAPSQPPVPHLARPLSLSRATNNFRLAPGRVTSLAWTPDGYALAVGWERGWAVWSTGGKLLGWGVLDWDDDEGNAREDRFMRGVSSNGGLVWVGGGLELIFLAPPSTEGEEDARPREQLYVLPFAKSSFTTLPTPSSTLYPLLVLSTKLLLSPTASLPSSSYLSSLTPSSSLWLPITLPQAYITVQYPIRYATVSEDGRLIAVAGRRGLTHWSRGSGRWKLFGRGEWEESFRVRGGMVWFLHVLVAGIEQGREHSIRLFSRDDALTPTSHLSSVTLPAPVHLISLHDNSLLVYTTANTFYHFLIVPTKETVELKLCGQINFDGVVAIPGRVRAMSWLIPMAQKKLGHPSDDLPLATVIFLIDSSLVLLRPRKPSRQHRRNSSLTTATKNSEEVKYDMQVLADRIETYWTHLSGVGTLENSLWGWDGEKLRVWLDALTVDRVKATPRLSGGGGDGEVGVKEKKSYERVGESVSISLDFYPLSVLMDKGIIIGIESELSTRRNLTFSTFKLQTSTHLFLPHLLRFHLSRGQIKAAVRFAAHFQRLSYFAHALEILLHGVLEQEADEGPGASPRIVDGTEWNAPLDALSPIVDETDDEGESDAEAVAADCKDSSSSKRAAGDVVESPSTLAPPCATFTREAGAEETKGVLPLVVEFLDHFPQALDVVVGCARKTEVDRWGFLFDVVGKPRDLFEQCLASKLFKTATSYLLVLHNLEQLDDSSTDTVRLLRAAMLAGEWTLCKDLLRFLHSADESGRVLRDAVAALGILDPDELEAVIGSAGAGGAWDPHSTAPSGASTPPPLLPRREGGSPSSRVPLPEPPYSSAIPTIPTINIPATEASHSQSPISPSPSHALLFSRGPTSGRSDALHTPARTPSPPQANDVVSERHASMSAASKPLTPQQGRTQSAMQPVVPPPGRSPGNEGRVMEERREGETRRWL